jgi:RNA polymerase sigma-70 factor (ECF subfamily)
MVAAQGGESHAYEQLLRELDIWLRRYYARRLSRPAADDARQDALLAIHAKRYAYAPSRPFGPWVAAIARHKWIDHLRDASRFATLSLDDEIPTEDHAAATISAIVVGDLLGQLKPAQACVIRLVKLQGVSIAMASGATGQSAALVKVNIHRGLRKLAALAACDAAASANPSMPRDFHPNRNRPTATAARLSSTRYEIGEGRATSTRALLPHLGTDVQLHPRGRAMQRDPACAHKSFAETGVRTRG